MNNNDIFPGKLGLGAVIVMMGIAILAVILVFTARGNGMLFFTLP
jgi:hypothetical protein